MYHIGGFAIFVGGLVIVLSGVLWAFAEVDLIAKKLALYGATAILLGLVPVVAVGPPRNQAEPSSAAVASDQAEAKPEPVAATKYDVRLHSWHCTTEYGYHQIDGEIENISDRPLDRVMIYATFKGSDGTVIKTAAALIDYQPLMPGQTSPFKVMATANPLIRQCFVSVGTMFGGALALEK